MLTEFLFSELLLWYKCCFLRMAIITARKRSLGQGNIFTSVCQEFCSRGGCLLLGGCLVRGGLVLGGAVWFRGEVPAPRGCLVGGVLVRGAQTPHSRGKLRGIRPSPPPPPDGYCCGRYASYWNAFLFSLVYTTTVTRQLIKNKRYCSFWCLFCS